MEYRSKQNMSYPRPMIFNMGSMSNTNMKVKPKELNLDYVSALPSQRYLYRGDNCQLMMKRNYSNDAITSTPVFSVSQLPIPMPLTNIVDIKPLHTPTKSGGGMFSITSIGNALSGMLTSIFGPKRVTTAPQMLPFEYQLNENHMRNSADNYDMQKQKILTIFDPKAASETSSLDNGTTFDDVDPYLRFMESPVPATPTKTDISNQDLETTPADKKTETVAEPAMTVIHCNVEEGGVDHEHKKRAKWIETKPKSFSKSNVGNANTHLVHSSSSFRHSHHKAMNKNRKEKGRREIFSHIKEDLSGEEEEEDVDGEGDEVQTNEKMTDSINSTLKSCLVVPCLTSTSDFPAIPQEPKSHLSHQKLDKTAFNNNNTNCRTSECDSDDNFIIFSTDVTTTTPETSYTGSPKKPQSRCKKLTDAFGLKRLSAFRQRQMSECSDDSFVCFEGGAADEGREDLEWSDCEDESDESSESESEDNESGSDTEEEHIELDEAKIQLDSGFEDKKVRFNLVPKVTVMHAWKFAYAQARKGPWEQMARDRDRFKNRVAGLRNVLTPILDDAHRKQVYRQRFSEEQRIEAGNTVVDTP